VRAAFALILLTACGPRAVLGARARTEPMTDIGGPAQQQRAAVVSAGELLETAETAEPGEPPTGIVISRLPAPHRFTVPTAFTPASPDAARALVGHRDPRTPLAFALDVAAAFTGATAPATATGEDLVRWAQERGAFVPIVAGTGPADGALAPGDLVVFDRALASQPASLVAVVLGADARGVTDILYLGRGVVRRGYLDPTRPTLARDREGHTVNSYIRHGTDHPPAGTRYLAGELASGRVRIR
jgi:hypothetical protein